MEQWFLLILNNAIIVSVLIVAICVLRFLFRKAPKRILCFLWVVVALKLIVPIQIESVFSLIPNSKPIPVSITAEKEPAIDSGVIDVDQKIKPIIQKHFSTKEENSINPLQIVMRIGEIIWLLGLFVMIIYAAISYILLKKELRTSIKVEDNIYECDYISSPFILGIVNPKIYYPSDMSKSEIEYVLKHEQAHLKRKDYLWKPLGFLLLAIYWFQPLCWVAYILLCKDIEYACDEKATDGKEKQWKTEYCQTLLNCSSSRKMIAVCPVAFGENSVKGRVKSIMNYKKPGFWIIILVVISFVGVSICFATTQKTNENTNKKQTSQKNVENNHIDASHTSVTSSKAEDDSSSITGKKFDFGNFYVENRSAVFDGKILYYSYDIVNNKDTDAITVTVDGEKAEVNYYVSNGYDSETKRIVMRAIIDFEKDIQRESCDLIISAKGSDKTYKDTVELSKISGTSVSPGDDEIDEYSTKFRDVKFDYGSSSKYSKEDMNEAINVILEEFDGWKGCELHSISYGSDEDCRGNLGWMQELENANDNKESFDECIMFKSDFHSPKNEEASGGLGFNSDCEYTDWQWWLARSKGGEWKLMTWGY